VANLAREEKAEAKLNPKMLGWSFLAGPWDHHVFQQVTEADIRAAPANATIPSIRRAEGLRNGTWITGLNAKYKTTAEQISNREVYDNGDELGS
jgi:hypothetical protein